MLRFYFSESFKSITRAKLASFFAIVTLSISIMFIATTFALIFLSNKIEDSWKNEIKVNLFISDSIQTKQLTKIIEKRVDIFPIGICQPKSVVLVGLIKGDSARIFNFGNYSGIDGDNFTGFRNFNFWKLNNFWRYFLFTGN